MILVVDDDPDIVGFIRMALEAEGIAVTTARNGRVALERLREVVPAVVLLDINMPVMDGPEFARQARKEFRDLPIIVMTAGTEVARYSQELQADDSRAKPFELTDLLNKIGRFVTA